MSIEALNWAWAQQTPNPTSKLVLLALADHANGDGECWPSMKKIAVMAQVSPRQVSYHITMLANLGLVEKASRRRYEGQLRGWNYRLLTTSGSVLPVASGSTAYPPAEAGFRSEPSENRQVEPLAAAPRERPRDELFEAVCQAAGHDQERLTRSERGAINSGLKDLRQVDATPEQVHAAAAQWPKLFPNATLTVPALVKHWSRLLEASPRAKIAKSCELCGQLLDDHDAEFCVNIQEYRYGR